MRLIPAAVVALAALSCTTVVSPPRPLPAGEPERFVRSVAFDQSGETIWFLSARAGSCSITSLDVASSQPGPERPLARCYTSLHALRESKNLLLLDEKNGGALFDGSVDVEIPGIAGARSASRYLIRNEEGLTLHDGAEKVKLGSEQMLRSFLLTAGQAVIAIERSDAGERLVRIQPEGRMALSPHFPAIDSFAMSPDEKELVFSAKVKDGFDVGLVSTAGSEVKWIPAERGDERQVSWAPRGNKVTYQFAAGDSTFLRTVHVPSSFQLTFGIPYASVGNISWEPKAERFAMVTSSLEHGDQIELVRYGGEERRPVLRAAHMLAGEIDRFPLENASAILTKPRELRYGETLPVVIWLTNSSPFLWSRDRAALAIAVPVAQIVVEGSFAQLDAGFWKALENTGWAGRDTYIVAAEGSPLSTEGRSVTLITAGEPGASTVRVEKRNGNRRVVLAPEGSAAGVESFAAGYIARELKERHGRG